MRHSNTSALIVFAGLLLLSACGSSTASNTNTAASGTNPTGTAGRFSYTIDGTRVETANNVQNANLFINEVSNDATRGMVKIAVTCLGSNVFDFDIANSGTTTIDNHLPPSPSALGSKIKAASYMDGKTYKNLYATSVTVSITSIDNSRISGTFSGTFKADESDGGATATFTAGSFNLPFIKN